MARDWLEIARSIEGRYPRAAGGVAADEVLRKQLVPWANIAMQEIERIKRWSLAYGKSSFPTVDGTAIYSIPSGVLGIKHVYRLSATGHPIPLRSYDTAPLREKHGEPPAPPAVKGEPRYYAVVGGQLTSSLAVASDLSSRIQLFPVPDAVYTIWVEGYQKLRPIVETVGATTAASAALTVLDGTYLQEYPISLPDDGAGRGLSVRDAGPTQFTGVRSDLFAIGWTDIAGNVVTMDHQAAAVVAAGQVFLDSRNWLIHDYPKVLEFAVLREVASRLKDDYKMWESRYQHELEIMGEADLDRTIPNDISVLAVGGENVPFFRSLDYLQGWDIRGGVL